MSRRRSTSGTRFIFGLDTKPMKFKGFKPSGNPFRGAILMQEGGTLPKYQNAGTVRTNSVKKYDKSKVNLSDLTFTEDDLSYINDPINGYCPSGDCLKTSKKVFDLLPASIRGIPSMGRTWESMNIYSKQGKPTEEEIAKYPYFAGDRTAGAVDSWDLQGKIIESNGNILYKKGDNLDLTNSTPGTFYSFGPQNTNLSNFSNRQKGYSTVFGLEPSHHTTVQVGYNEKGEPIIYDSHSRRYGTITEISDLMKKNLGYELETVGTPSVYKNLTKSELQKKGILTNTINPYKRDISKLGSLLTQDWAQIKEDGKSRAPRLEQDKMVSFYNSLSKNKPLILKALNLRDKEYDELADMALAIAMTESEGGGALNIFDRLGSTRGLTQLNPDNVLFDDRLKRAMKMLPKDIDYSNLGNEEISAISTMLYLSLAKTDSDRLFKKGLNPKERFFEKPSFLNKLVGRDTVTKINNDGVFIDELNKRIPVDQIEKLPENIRSRYKIQDGKLIMQTKGNNPNLTPIEKIGYFWQSPLSLKSGDAEGKSVYVNRLKNYFENIQKFQQGGPIKKEPTLEEIWGAAALQEKQKGGVIVDPMGQWRNPYQETIVPTQDGRITMRGVNYPLLGIDETGDTKVMFPNREYQFKGKNIYEIPLFKMQSGGGINTQMYDENAEFSYYKKTLYDALRNKNPQQFELMRKELSELAKDPIKHNSQDRQKVTSKYDISLPISEVKNLLGRNYDRFDKLRRKYYNFNNGLTEKSENDYNVYSVNDLAIINHPSSYVDGNLKYEPVFDENGLSVNTNIPGLKSFTSPSKTMLAKKKKGGFTNPYKMQQGGFSLEQAYKFLFDDEEENNAPVTAPSESELEELKQEQFLAGQKEAAKRYNKELRRMKNQQAAMSIADLPDDFETFVSGKGFIPTSSKSNSSENYVPTVSKAQATEIAYQKGAQAVKYLQEKYGLPKHVAAGIAGNAMQESSFRDDVIAGSLKGDEGQSFGLFQWFGSRNKDFFNWAKQNNRNPYDMYTQLDFGIYEAKQRGDLQATMKAQNATEAANIWRDRFEKPKVKDVDRAQYANTFMNFQIGGTYDVDIPTLLEIKRKGYKYKII